jgi:hypothetical protein
MFRVELVAEMGIDLKETLIFRDLKINVPYCFVVKIRELVSVVCYSLC